MKNNKQRPTLNFTNDPDGVEVQITFGYYKGEPTAALFHKETLVLIPKDVLQIAFQQGWDVGRN
jgi:predicted nucleotidyltransferase